MPKLITLEKMRKFSGRHGKSIHVDEKFARQAVLQGPITQGLMSYAYLIELMVSSFGEGWLKSGKLSVNFLHYVLPGDLITAKAVFKSKEGTESGDRVGGIEVWCENQRGGRVVAGTAPLLFTTWLNCLRRNLGRRSGGM